jgi:hypothetical protein
VRKLGFACEPSDPSFLTVARIEFVYTPQGQARRWSCARPGREPFVPPTPALNEPEFVGSGAKAPGHGGRSVLVAARFTTPLFPAAPASNADC